MGQTKPVEAWLRGSLVTTAWLAGHIALPGLCVLDATIVKEPLGDLRYLRRPAAREFETDGHIPGARFADLAGEFSDARAALPFTCPGEEQLAAVARTHGIGHETFVVVYDSLDGIWAARLWWVLRAFGHERVAVLDGGLRKWLSEERPVERGPSALSNSAGSAWRPVRNSRSFVDREYVLGMLKGRREGLLCNALRRPVFSGAEQAYARPGRIPGSLPAPYDELIDRTTNALLPVEVLRERLAHLLVQGERVVTYCGGGVTAAGIALALTVCGADDIAIYDDSLNEWAADPALPLIVD
ncbi:3-mercaptopyruvate sulfurtransferase [Paraburkholderia unamae]|nr:rhodanese-like domain-containing protein [Paraburkholderia unamae]CAG9251983.1 3-mercaptopyruvate sulfurtransferase [Paraburkholderia unamae]